MIAQSDLLAAGVLRAAATLGLTVPDDVSVVGFDGADLPWLEPVRLTTVVQPTNEKGQAAARAAMRCCRAGAGGRGAAGAAAGGDDDRPAACTLNTRRTLHAADIAIRLRGAVAARLRVTGSYGDTGATDRPERRRRMASGERVSLARETATVPPLPPPQNGMRSMVPNGRTDDVPDVVPRILRVCAALGWRLLVVVAALYVIGLVVSYVAAVVVPVAIALLLAALLAPAVHQLQNRQVPRGLATAIVLIGGLALLGGVLAFVVVTFVRGVPDLATQLTASINDIAAWLRNGPLQLSDSQLSRFQTEILNTLSANQASITAGALTTAATVGETLTEILLVVFTLIFFLHAAWRSGSSCWASCRTGCGTGWTWRGAGAWPRW